MREFRDYIGTVTYPVIDFRRINRYINGVKSDILDSRYTVLHAYEQISITVADDGTAIT